MTTRRTVQAEAAATLRRVLEAVEQGELDLGGPKGVELVRRMEGAATALEQGPGPGGPGAKAAALLRRLIDSVDDEEYAAPGRQAALLRRMEGAAVALEANRGQRRRGPEGR